MNTETESSASSTPADTIEPGSEYRPDGQPFRPITFAVGAFIVALGLSGLLDDSGLLPNRPWAVLVVAAVAIAIAVAVSTVSKLSRPAKPLTNDA